jgi:5'(3')-deoxyribonucleotidase
MKKILYIDMDNVLVDFQTGIDSLSHEEKIASEGEYDNVSGIFSMMEPMKDAIDAFNILSDKYDVYILSTAPWGNPSAWTDKLLWVKHFLGEKAKKRLILSHNKHLAKGDYLIDDRLANGAKDFEGELLLFGSDKFPDWSSVIAYLNGV